MDGLCYLFLAEVTLNFREGEGETVAQSAAQDRAPGQHKHEQERLENGDEVINIVSWGCYVICIYAFHAAMT